MTQRPRVVLLTGDGRRHQYAAERLSKAFDLAGLLIEAKPQISHNAAEAVVAPTPVDGDDDAAVVRRHLGERDVAEALLLEDPIVPDGIPTRQVPTGGSNAPEVLEWVLDRTPEFILLYGTSIIRAPLLDAFEGRVVNMHLGLSPYYRGAGTNFWPLVHRRPECVGATIHLATLKVDAGAILTQVRPQLENTDRAHEIGTKTIIAGVEGMARAVAGYAAGTVHPREQDLTIGEVFRRRDFNADAVRQMWAQFDGGMVAEYLTDESARRARFPIVEQV